MKDKLLSMQSDDLAYLLKNLRHSNLDTIIIERDFFKKSANLKITTRLLKNLESLYEMKTDPDSIKL